MTTKVSIIGGSGYGAAEVMRNLLPRQDVEIRRVSSKDRIGESISAVHRSIGGYDDLILEDIPPRDCVEGADFVFLCMPHITTAKVAADLLDLDVRIIDLSGDFRLERLEDYTAAYAPTHPCPERLGTFVYGMPELYADEIAGAKHVASPGCFATAITMGLLPLTEAGLLENTPVRTVAATGSSGSGVRPQAGTHHAIRDTNLKVYKVLSHQHQGEILQTLRNSGPGPSSLDFVPMSAPLVRGILAISMLDVPGTWTDEAVRKLFTDWYAGHPLVRVMAPGASPEIVAVAGTARVEIGVETKAHSREGVTSVAVTTAIDNLIKGGAGQAIQSFNLMTGKPFEYGLTAPGLWP